MTLSELNISPRKEKQFNSKGIYTTQDLVRYLPRKYNDFSHITGILPETENSCLVVTIDKVQSYNKKVSVLIAYSTVVPSGEKLHLSWFNQSYLSGSLSMCIGQQVYVAGKVTYNEQYKNYSMTPEIFERDIKGGQRVYPVYPKISGMSMDYLVEKVRLAMADLDSLEETCPPDILATNGQLSTKEALLKLHNPASMQDVLQAQERLVFDDLLYFALNNEWARRNSAIGSSFSIKTLKSYYTAIAALPYNLTNDQQATLKMLLEQVKNGRRINALVQGDVGCGKTIVAFLMMLAFADSGYQSVLMAPTQVLARQHYDDLTAMVSSLGLKAVYLGGSDMKAAERKAVLKAIADGSANFIVGTNAVIGKNVVYHKLALTITDEEHRFGVEQRSALVEKAAEGVHSITMSATPIPRSLAQVIYGDAVQLCTIHTMPSNRKPIITGIATTKDKLFRFIVKQAKAGKQTYVVCPLIDPNDEDGGPRSVTEVSEEYQKALGPYGIRIATLTGRDSKETTESVLAQFRAGGIDVLIATTVIEVGVNVPTATTMVISNAERFGLSELHQLRGRVGRGAYQSYCVLDSQNPTEIGAQRLQAMVDTTDGFKIAEEDLRLRGAGDFIGTKQSGDNKYMALMLAYPDKYQQIQKIANDMLDKGTDCPIMERVRERQTKE